MKKANLRNVVLSILIAGGFILLDLVLDLYLNSSGRFSWLHLVLAASVMLISYDLLSRAQAARRRTEAVLRQSYDEMENRVRDRTAELEQANEALRLSEETFRALMDASTESAILLDSQGIILAANETAARRLGAPVERLLQTSLFDFLAPEIGERTRIYLADILQSSQPVHFSDEWDGRTFDTQVCPVIDSDGRIIRLATFSEDITDLLHAEEAHSASAEKYRLLFENMAEGFALYELLYDDQGEPVDWRILEVNGAYTHHTGIARRRIVGRRISELFPEAIPKYLPRFAAVVATQTPSEFETYAQAVVRYQRVSTFPAGGHRFASIIEDITKRVEGEEALRQAHAELLLDAQKRSALEERQRLARELHDSVAQALYGISLGLQTALTLFDTDCAKVLEALNYALSLARAGLAEIRALIFELRPESLESEGLMAALSKQAEALRARYGIEVGLSVCVEPDVPIALKEAMYGIAREAMQNTIRHAQADRLEVRLDCDPETLSLEVSDNGVGFDPQTDFPGHLGLRSMHERVARVGGTLEIVSGPGSGTHI